MERCCAWILSKPDDRALVKAPTDIFCSIASTNMPPGRDDIIRAVQPVADALIDKIHEKYFGGTSKKADLAVMIIESLGLLEDRNNQSQFLFICELGVRIEEELLSASSTEYLPGAQNDAARSPFRSELQRQIMTAQAAAEKLLLD